MDLNYLFSRQQISHFMADNAACERSRGVHRSLAAAYGDRIDAVRLAGVAAAVGPNSTAIGRISA